MAVDTGHAATISFGTQGWSGRVLSIGGHTETREAIETTYLATSGHREYMVPDVTEPGEFTIVVQYEGTVGVPTFAAAETVTVTHPLASGESTAANIAGTAFVTSRGFPSLETDTLKTCECTIKWDGLTGPTITAAT